MKYFWQRVCDLIKVKTIVTFAVTGIFAQLAINNYFSPDTVMTVVVMVISFYFGTQFEKNSHGGDDERK